jgi:hypothetical protein
VIPHIALLTSSAALAHSYNLPPARPALAPPALQLFNVWVAPEVEISVCLEEGSPSGVLFESGACR